MNKNNFYKILEGSKKMTNKEILIILNEFNDQLEFLIFRLCHEPKKDEDLIQSLIDAQKIILKEMLKKEGK